MGEKKVKVGILNKLLVSCEKKVKKKDMNTVVLVLLIVAIIGFSVCIAFTNQHQTSSAALSGVVAYGALLGGLYITYRQNCTLSDNYFPGFTSSPSSISRLGSFSTLR